MYINSIVKDDATGFETVAGISTLDVANYAVTTQYMMESMHSVALQSLFGIPLLGNVTRKR